MQTCPDCHSFVNDSAVFCDNCGFRLKPTASIPSSPAGGGLVSPPAGSGYFNPMVAASVVVNAAPGTCSACGYANTPGEMFCQNCGVQLAPVASIPPPPPTPISASGAQLPTPSSDEQSVGLSATGACPVCGFTNLAGETFCQNCGVALIPVPQEPSAEPESPVSNPSPPASKPLPPVTTTPGKCPVCGYANQAGEAFCQNCGMELVASPPPAVPDLQPPDFAAQTPLPSPEPPIPSPKPPVSGPCPTCGHINPPEEMYCQNCGLLLSAAETLPPVYAFAASSAEVTPAAPALPVSEAPAPPFETSAPSPQPHDSAPKPSAPDTKPLEPLSNPPAASPQPPASLIGHLVVAETQANLPLPYGPAGFLIGRSDPARGILPEIDLSQHGGENGGVSRLHARLTVNGAQVLIEDLQSLNSTFLNKQRLPPGQRFPLNNGDEIRLGKFVLIFYNS